MTLGRWWAAALVVIANLASAVEPELQWPWYRGPFSNGVAVPSGQELAAEPRVLWHSTEFTKQTGGTISGSGLSGGCQSLVLHDGKVYCAFFVGSQDPVVLDARRAEKDPDMKLARALVAGGARHSNGAPLARVGIEDPEMVQRMLWNVHGDDVMVCFDAETGKTLWKTVVPGAIHNTGATYGPHLTPAVDPGTGKVYAVGVDGRILCFDGTSGEVLWINEDHLRCDRAEAIAARKGVSTNRSGYEYAVAVEGVVVVGGRALDGATGKERWATRAHWFWLPWRHAGRWYLINGGTRCIDPQTGKDLWKLPRDEVAATQTGEYDVAITFHEDRMVCGNACYRISPEGRELVWRNEDLITKSIRSGVVVEGVYYTAAFDPRDTPAAREALAGRSIESRRYRKALKEELQKRARHHQQGGLLVGLSMADGSLVHVGPPLGPVDTGGLLVAMGGYVYWKNKGPGSYYWLDVDAEHMGLTAEPGKDDALSAGYPDGSQVPACYKGRMYVRGRWSVACLDFTRP